MSDRSTALGRLVESKNAAIKEIWQAKDALYEYVRTDQMDKAKDMAQRIYIYEKVFEELWPPESPNASEVKVPSRHGLDYEH